MATVSELKHQPFDGATEKVSSICNMTLFFPCHLSQGLLCPLKHISMRIHQYGFWEGVIMLGIMVNCNVELFLSIL